MTALIVDKRIVESVLKAVPTKSKSVNRSRVLKITEGGWLLAFSGDATTGFAVRIAVDEDNANMVFGDCRRIEPGFYSRDALARWVHPMGGGTPEPLTEADKKHIYPGEVSVLTELLEPFAVDDLGHRETVADPEDLMLPMLCLAPVLKIKCVQAARTPKLPPKPLTALHVGWEKRPRNGSGLWVVAWHSNRLRAVAVPVRNGVPQ
nr:MAG TPA: hypothetical protein [Caudoviricetes sp.]